MSGRSRVSEGDWVCSDSKCANVNFARRLHCNRCGREKDSGPAKRPSTEIGKAAAERSRGLFSADDWQCSKCGNVNWARRLQCNMCNAPKLGDIEERTGYGGGYNERENVEYIERDESDGEYDEFGRKKKKFRGETSTTSVLIPPKTDVVGDLNEEDEEDDEGDISKYKLDSEDDDDDDLSKYKLDDSDDDKKNIVKRRSNSRSRSSSHSKSSSRSRTNSNSPTKRDHRTSSGHSGSRSRSSTPDSKPRKRKRSRSLSRSNSSNSSYSGSRSPDSSSNRSGSHSHIRRKQ